MVYHDGYGGVEIPPTKPLAPQIVTRAVTSGKNSCSDTGRDFIRASFAANFFARYNDNMVSAFWCSIVVVAEAIGDLRDAFVGGDFMVSTGGRSVLLTCK